MEEALVTVRTAYDAARRSTKVAALAALASLVDFDEDDRDGGDHTSSDGWNLYDNAAASLDDGGWGGADASTNGMVRRSERPPLEGCHYLEATPAWAAEVAALEHRRAKDVAARRGGGAGGDADGWVDADADGPYRVLVESAATRMRRRSL